MEEQAFIVSALPWDAQELEQAGHVYELPSVTRTVVTALSEEMGLAGDDSWGARPAPEYLLPLTPLRFRLRLRAVAPER